MVANDIMFNRTKLQDGYNKVGLITIPANKVTEVRAFTNTMSGDSDCMSWSNPRMTHAVVAETHFSMAKIMIPDSMSKYKRGVSVVDIKLRTLAFGLWRWLVKMDRCNTAWRYPIYRNPDCSIYCQAPCRRPESFPGTGSYRFWPMRGAIKDLKWMLPQARTSDESCVVLLDWCSGHATAEVADIVKKKGHVLVFHGGGTTPLTQANDTHFHGATHSRYMRMELEWSASEQM
jgi:hypothetical protein